ncbi:MAG TPA: Crp/Fnr family transcriptional regulator [Chitinophagaceae bacterium]|nr:Crp/Fnr family transcriptional regulator [Chitinophagaceae bacterium]
MLKDKFIQYIKETIPQFTVSESGVDRIIDSFEEMTLGKGEYLLKQGKISGYYVLLSGHMRGYTFNGEGIEITTDFYAGERVVFDGASFFLRQPSEVNIVSLSECKGYYTNYDKLNAIFHEVPEFREFGRAILVKEFVMAQKQKLALFSKSAEQRYLEIMQQGNDLLQVAQLRHIASFLGITDTSLSRIRRELAKK